jgi:DEAD/DEAH box helicase domain-containing protein
VILFFDLETQKLAHEVGGWGNIEALGMSVGCTYDDQAGYRDWWEAQAADLLDELRRAELIVGFNVNVFDYRVLSLYGNSSDLEERTFDMLDEIFQQTGKRVGLNTLSVLNLGEAKVFESGVSAVRLWKTGKLEELVAYCRRDVELTKRLYEHWEAQGILWTSSVDYVVWPGQRITTDKRMEDLEDEEASDLPGA